MHELIFIIAVTMNNSSLLEQTWGNHSRTLSEDELVSDIDPMLEVGTYKVAFHRQCPFEVRQRDTEGKEFAARDMLTVRIMGNPNCEGYTDLKIEISSETDLYMVYECKLNDRKFDRIRKSQNLNFGFSNLLPMLIKQLTLCDKFPEQYLLVLYLSQTSCHQLTIVENIEYKSIELLNLDFQPIDPELKKQYLLFRFSVLKAKNERIEQKTNDMLSMVKLKNPNLLQVIAKKTNSTTLGASSMVTTVYQNRSMHR